MGKKILFLVAIFLLLQSAGAYAYVIKGTIVDEKDVPIRKAVVVGRNSANKVKVGIETNRFGQFESVNVTDSTLLLEIAKENYAPMYINVMGTADKFVDLGIVKLKPISVELEEVTVTAQSVIQKTDRYIVIPSVSEIAQSSNGLSLLNNLQYKMPGLEVNESMQSVKVEDKTPMFKINGKPSNLSAFLSLKPQDVLRIEYHDSPDVRYGNRQVINVILKPREDGGSVVSNLVSAVTTGNTNGNVGVNYHSRKSEWDLIYRMNLRDYDEREISSEGEFIGRDKPIIRKRTGIPGDFGYITNEFLLGYTYYHNPNTVFMARLGLTLDNRQSDDNSTNMQSYKDNLLRYTNLTHWDNNFKLPNFDLFFRKQFDKTQYIEAIMYGSYSRGDYSRSFVNIFDDSAAGNDSTITLTTNKSWLVGGELMYSKTFKHFTTNFGIQGHYNSIENGQVEKGFMGEDDIYQNRTSVYGQISGRIKNLRYSASAQGVYNYSNNNSYTVSAVRSKSNLNMNYPLSKHVTLNYLMMYDPSMPSISQQSTMVQTIDEISVKQGNPDLKPSEYLRNRVYVRYANKKFTGSLWAAYSRTFDPIYYSYSYIGDVSSPYYDKFMRKPINGKHDDLINLELNLSMQNLFGFATIWGKLGWDNYNIELNSGSYTKNRFYASLNGNFKFGDWLMSANYAICPRYSLSGNMFTSNDRWNTIKIQYRYRNWLFSASGVNMFTKRGSTYEQITISDVHPEYYTANIKSNANMIMLGVSYSMEFGKKTKKINRRLNNGSIDSGVDTNY